jgi:hypothetical protein
MGPKRTDLVGAASLAVILVVLVLLLVLAGARA